MYNLATLSQIVKFYNEKKNYFVFQYRLENTILLLPFFILKSWNLTILLTTLLLIQNFEKEFYVQLLII